MCLIKCPLVLICIYPVAKPQGTYRPRNTPLENTGDEKVYGIGGQICPTNAIHLKETVFPTVCERPICPLGRT